MEWKQIVGWQLLAFGALWAIVVYDWGGASWNALVAVPHVLETVMSEPELAGGARYAAYAPGLVAVLLGAALLWDARRPRRSLAEQLAEER